MRSTPVLAITTLAVAVFAACSSASQPPLGGPFGGAATANPPPSPNAASTGSSSSGSSGSSSGAASSSGSSGGGGSDDSGSAGSSSGCSSAANTPSGGAGSGASNEGGSAPTWTKLWTEYLAAGTVGGCAKAGCHGTAGQCDTPSDCYAWLDSYSDICGGINNDALFTWTPNGFMPMGGPTSEPNVVADFAAWTAAGSQNN